MLPPPTSEHVTNRCKGVPPQSERQTRECRYWRQSCWRPALSFELPIRNWRRKAQLIGQRRGGLLKTSKELVLRSWIWKPITKT
mmetsp:Transcript_128098/g.319683  ORF Transcript_128098/g.319683 Transcript_128098/m.319683 type:complete len:84 (+) Transcript_128098:1213-1464(+)